MLTVSLNEWLGTKIKQNLEAGREKEEDRVKDWNLDLKGRCIFWIRRAIQGEKGPEADFAWADPMQTEREKIDLTESWPTQEGALKQRLSPLLSRNVLALVPPTLLTLCLGLPRKGMVSAWKLRWLLNMLPLETMSKLHSLQVKCRFTCMRGESNCPGQHSVCHRQWFLSKDFCLNPVVTLVPRTVWHLRFYFTGKLTR